MVDTKDIWVLAISVVLDAIIVIKMLNAIDAILDIIWTMDSAINAFIHVLPALQWHNAYHIIQRSSMKIQKYGSISV